MSIDSTKTLKHQIKELESIPKSVREVISQAIAAIHPNKVILFGSRARGDNRRLSDVDLGFTFSPERKKEWVRFLVDLPDNAPTLYKIDMVDMASASHNLKTSISDEGIVIYDSQEND